MSGIENVNRMIKNKGMEDIHTIITCMLYETGASDAEIEAYVSQVDELESMKGAME